MITKIQNIGFAVYGETIGELWLELIEAVLENGVYELDENRGRFTVKNLRFSAGNINPQDVLIDKYGDKKKIETMKKIFFESDVMEDFDITPSFRIGAKSYKKRLEEGRMQEFVIKRLSKIPESKKAVMVFPTYEDYISVLNSPWDDYLPCITALQFRISKRKKELFLDLTLFMRSWDCFQKGAGDLTVICMLAEQIKSELEKNLNTTIGYGRLDGLVTDVHIYENTLDNAQRIFFAYKNKKDV